MFGHTPGTQSVFDHYGITDAEMEAAFAGDHAHYATVIHNHVSKVAMFEGEIRSTGETLARRMAETTNRLDEGHNLNSLGTLQSTAVEYDRLHTQRQDAIEALKATCWLYRQEVSA